MQAGLAEIEHHGAGWRHGNAAGKRQGLSRNQIGGLCEFRLDLECSPKRLHQILTARGIRVPDDVGIAGTTVLDIPISAGIDQNSEEIGRVGLLMLNSLINDGARGIPRIFRQILVEGSWVDGPSLPNRKG